MTKSRRPSGRKKTRLKKLRVLMPACLLSAAVLSGCGGGTSAEEPDEASTKVIQLTITPRPSPTPLPKEAYPKATANNEDVTMLNQYLVDHGKGQ